ncbi:MAG: hypothetical protein RLZZ313_754, partial [Verrucomicrobiota bacterium]
KGHPQLAGRAAARSDVPLVVTRVAVWETSRRVTACALAGVGELCRSAEHHFVATELLNCSNPNDHSPYKVCPAHRRALMDMPGLDHEC